MLLFVKPALAIKGASVAISRNEVVGISRLLVGDCDFMRISQVNLPEKIKTS